jgi:uncharacterized protein (UPF0332 family)
VSPDEYLLKARRALASARLLLADGDPEGACNRAYYGMFDAAHAALSAVAPDLDLASAKTHRGLIGAFGEQLVKPGRVRPDLGRALNQVERVRLLADYTGEGIGVAKAQWAIDQAAAFLESIETSLAAGGENTGRGPVPNPKMP